MTDRKARAKVYRKAAMLCQNGEYASCFAVNQIVNGGHEGFLKDTSQALRYARLFSPDETSDHGMPWGISWGNQLDKNGNKYFESSSIRQGRVLALCFMAAMVEAGDA